jgi:hypothetical protein
VIAKLWEEECEQVISLILGHASDGDSCHRQLMLQDYTSSSGNRYAIPWDGWLLSGCLGEDGSVQGLHDQDYIYNGKKLVNPLDSPVKVLQLGGDLLALEHVGLVYNRFTFDEHGLRAEDVQRSDRQNWASAQQLCQLKVRNCLEKLRTCPKVHQERCLGILMYLEICSNYIDIFLSESLDLRGRVVLAAKVSFFFRLWKLWLKHGDHGVLDNSKSLNAQESFVNQQCFIDIQISCHFVILLIAHF